MEYSWDIIECGWNLNGSYGNQTCLAGRSSNWGMFQQATFDYQRVWDTWDRYAMPSAVLMADDASFSVGGIAAA